MKPKERLCKCSGSIGPMRNQRDCKCDCKGCKEKTGCLQWNNLAKCVVCR